MKKIVAPVAEDHVAKAGIASLNDAQMRRSVYIAALLAMVLPPFVGGSLMGLMGFYPMPEFYFIFTDYRVVLYMATALLLSLLWAARTARYVLHLPRFDRASAHAMAQRRFARLPWILLGSVTLYSMGGALSADIALETMGVRDYGLRDHLHNQLGLVPVVLVTVFPIFFYFVDRIGRYLGPRGISVVAIPLWMKLLMLGIVTPLLIDSVLVGYYFNRTGHFEWEVAALWLSLAGLAAGGTWLAWRSLRQGIAPLQDFIAAQAGSIPARARASLTPLSLDEFGVLTARYADLLTSRETLSDNLLHAESLANTVIDAAGALVVVLDREGRISRFNRACQQLSGYTFAEVEGKYPWDMLLPPEDADTIRRDAFEALAHKPQAMAGHYTNFWVSKTGMRYMIEWSNTLLLDANGAMDFMVCVGIDVTERMRHERDLTELNETLEARVQQRTAEVSQQFQRIEALLSTMQDGFFAADTTGRIHHVNPAICAMLGYSEAELLAMGIPDIEANESPEMVAAHIRRVLAAGRDRFETWHRRKDGSVVEVELSVSVVTIVDAPMFYAFSRDITSRRVGERTLRQARDDAERANAAKSEFLSRMSHELRTPLNAILGFAQMLALPGKTALDAQQADNVQEILKAGQHLLAQVNEVLDLARIDSGRIELSLEPVGVAAAVADCLAQLKPLAEQRGIAMNAAIDAALAVQADHIRFKQVLLNLLSNAIKYNRDGGRIDLTASVEQGRARVAVRDTGRGIAPEKLERLFKPFERLESSYDGIEGTGIGLALVKRLVEAMGGEIGVESEVGAGSTFWFALPAATLPSLPETAPPKVSAGGTAIATDVAKESQHLVLYIEDNPSNLKLIQKIIRLRPEFALLDAMNAELGLEIARREQPDLILLDINLPGMDGFAAIAQLKEWPETACIPVIAVTANAMKRDIERGKAAGFADYLAKPIDIDRLNQILDKLPLEKCI